jgi:hypothetical protein
LPCPEKDVSDGDRSRKNEDGYQKTGENTEDEHNQILSVIFQNDFSVRISVPMTHQNISPVGKKSWMTDKNIRITNNFLRAI